MRRKFVAGNWKMNTTRASGQALAQAVEAEAAKLGAAIDVAVCPPFPYLSAIKDVLKSGKVTLGAQNAYFTAPGAYTGEVAVEMLKDVGCNWVILGHSERRQLLQETDDLINKKIAAATSQDLGVIFCVGEKLDERQGGKMDSVLDTQLSGGLSQIDAVFLEQIVIAYEPVWAIGTGVTATPDQAESAHQYIRNWVAKNHGARAAESMRILYGGSVKPDNAATLMGQPNVDGALVGGASLTPDQFLPIIRAAAQLAG